MPVTRQKEFRPKLAEALKKLETHLAATDRSHGKFLFGQATPSAADIYLLPFLYRATYIDYFRGYNPLASAPGVLAYYHEATAALQPAFAAAVPPAADLFARLKKFVPKLPVVSGNMLQHESIRLHGRAVVADLRAAMGPGELEARRTALARANTTFQRLATFIAAHASYEDRVLWPLFEAVKPGVTAAAAAEHVEETAILGTLADQVRAAAAKGDVDDTATLEALATGVQAFMEHSHHHMAGEEGVLNPISQTWSADQQAAAMHDVCAVADPLQEDAFVMHPFNGPQVEQYVYNLAVLYRQAQPAHFKNLVARIKASSVQQPWIFLQERSPDIAALVAASD